MERANNLVFLLTGLDVQQLLDLLELGVLLELLLGFALQEGIHKLEEELGNSVSSKRNLNGGNQCTTVTEGEEVLVVDVVRDESVMGLNPLDMLSEARVDFFDEFGSNKVVRASKTSVDGLDKGKNGAGLPLLVPCNSSQWSVQLSKVLDSAVDKGADGTVGLEPGGHGKLLPNGDVSVSAVKQEGHGSGTDFGVLTTVEGSRDKDGKDLLLNDLVGDRVKGLAVSGNGVLSLFMLVQTGAGLDEVLEGIDSLDLDEGIGLLIQDLLNGFNNIGGSEVGQRFEEDGDPVGGFRLVFLKALLKLLDEEGDEFLGDELGVTELSVKGDRVAGVLDALVDTGLVGQDGESQHGASADLLLALDGSVFNEVLCK